MLSDAAPAAITILSGQPSASELAAVTAVMLTAAAEAADEPAPTPAGTNLWHRNPSSLRFALSPGRGAWRDFTS
ncbi:MAG: acyl-CoA carboxylase subunit epsilon [Microbacteriaceae bacterium]|nr:acyl-CoA carboxylase subunit epsilon [Microbacteriaceae bacterium]